jgi:hypothetical protein
LFSKSLLSAFPPPSKQEISMNSIKLAALAVALAAGVSGAYAADAMSPPADTMAKPGMTAPNAAMS